MIWEPFKIYVCDHCGGTMHADEGWLEWMDDGQSWGWRIVHHRRKCMAYADLAECCDNYLPDFIQNKDQNFLGLVLREGAYGNIDNGLRVKSYADFTDMLFRLTVPHYEQARQYFQEELENGMMSRRELMTPDHLRKVICRYEAIDTASPVSAGFEALGVAAKRVLADVRQKMKNH